MSRSSKLREEATEILIKAVKHDQSKKYTEALPYYKEGINKLRLAVRGKCVIDLIMRMLWNVVYRCCYGYRKDGITEEFKSV